MGRARRSLCFHAGSSSPAAARAAGDRRTARRRALDPGRGGNQAVLCVLFLAQAVAGAGRSAYPGLSVEIGGLPRHRLLGPGGTTTKPCAEAVLGERAVERIMDRGLMPLISMRDSDRIRLLRFQSVAEPMAALAGRWMTASLG